MAWMDENLGAGAAKSYSIQYGIVASDADPNIDGAGTAPVPAPEEYTGQGGIWIQCSANKGDGFYLHTCDATANGLKLDPPVLSADTLDDALDTLERVDAAIGQVLTYRGLFGADQNRLQRAKNVDAVMHENVAASESRIRDADMAGEMTKLTKQNVLSQAAQAMLAQANQQPEQVLQMLR